MHKTVTAIFFLISVISCSGGGGGGQIADTLTEFEIKDNFCQVTVDEDSTDLDSLLFSQCSDSFSAAKLSSANRVVLDAGNTCDFISIDGSHNIVSQPTDDDVGTCDFQIAMNDGSGTVYAKAKIFVRNIDPLLNIPDVNNVQEDSAMQVVLSDVLVQASDENYGVYFIDNDNTTGTRCVDNGSVSIDETTGAVSFGPNLNYSGVCNVMVGFDDQNPGSNVAYNEFSITVVTTNDQPDITGSCSTASLNQDATYTCSTLSFVDNDSEDTHTWSLAPTNTCSWVTVNSSTGAISGTPNDDHVGGCNVSVIVNDGNVDSLPYTRAVTVNNITPVISPITLINPITEDDPATVVLSGVNVTSSEEGYGLFSLDHTNTTGTKCSDNGTVAIDANTGEVTYTPAANFDQDCNVRIVFDDGNPSGNTDVQQVTIAVTAANDQHVITSACPLNIDELAAYNCTGAYTDVENDTVTWAFGTGHTCSWAAINSTNGNITGTPQRADVGTCDLVVEADDGEYQITRTYNITVDNVQPSFTIADVSLAEDSPATEIRADADVSSTDEGYGTYSVIAASSNDCQAQGTVSVDASTGAVTFAPNINYDTNCNIRIQFDDGKATDNIGTDEFVVTMIADPDNAVVSLPAACSGNHDEDVAYNCTPTITDPDTGDTHTWSIDGGANTCSWITGIVGATGVMAGTPNDNHVGSCSFTIKATGDQDGLVSSLLTANITVDNVKPIISFGTNPSNINMQHTTAPAAYSAVVQNIATDFNIVSTDETYGVYSLVAPTTGTDCSTVADTLTIDANSGVVSFLPNNMYVGSCNVGISFDDQNATDNVADTYDLTINVQDQVPPLVTYVDSLNGASDDGLYTLDQSVTLVVKFDEPVVVDTTGGSPRIFLETGAIDREATYTGQSSDLTEMRFLYTVQTDDKTSDLEVHSTVNYLDLGGALVEDGYGNTEVNFPVPKPADATLNSLSERRAISVDGAVAAANATGLPTLVSPASFLDVTVSGGDVVNYRYKVKQVGSANDTCLDSTDYSADVPVATKITDSLVPFPLGSSIRICIIGVNSSGILQPYSTAFEYVWSKDVKSVQKISFSAINNLPNFQDSEVDPDNPNIIYARNLLGEIYKSTDYGVEWVKQCSVPQTYATDMFVSPGPDRTPYVGQDSTLYKIIDNNGGACENLLTAASLNVRTGYGANNIQFAINGDIYIFTEINGPKEIWRSFDQGANWSLYTTVTAGAPSENTFTLNPFDVSSFLITGAHWQALNAGIYKTIDGGVTYSRVNNQLNDRTHSLHWHPTNANLVYSSWRVFNHKSFDGGDTWEAAGASAGAGPNPTNYYQRFDIDKVTGHAYRVDTSGSDTILQRATDITSSGTISWTTIYTFSGVTGTSPNGRNVSVSGNSVTPTEPTISININNRMWISSDGGSNFIEVFAPEELKLATIAGAGDNAIYGATKDWFVVKTSDNGDNWSYQVGDYYHCLGKPPRLAVNQLDTDNILMWTENYADINCDNFNYSTNAMNTLINRDDFSMEAPKLVVSMSPYDPKKYYISGKPAGSFRFNRTANSAFETTLKYSANNEFSSPMPDSYIHPHNDDIVWIVDDTGTGVLYEYDIEKGTRTDISSNTGLASISAIDIYPGDKGQYFLRVMDRTGRMRVSSDYGATFSNEGTTTSPLDSCNKRFLYHHPRDRNLVVTACVKGNVVGLSKDSGQTWDETDFQTDYDINCGITGLAISSSRIYLGCESADTMIFNYSFARLKNDIADNILTVSENGNTTDLVEHFFPDLYDTLEYKVIPAANSCDATEMASGTSTTIPKSNDPVFTTRGEYKVCIKQTDSTANVSYSVTSTVFFDTGAPTFTSIDLVGDVSDGELTFVENENRNYLVGNLVSTNHDFIRYSLVKSATTCDGSLDYTYELPKSNDPFFKEATTYKVCVELSTRGGQVVYGSSSNITYVPTAVVATLTGVPEAFVSIDQALNITVGGTNVTQYKYKVATGTNYCSQSTGYSAATPISTPITEDLTSFSSGDSLRLCVIGGDSSGYFQRMSKATVHYWVYSTNHRFDYVDMSNVSTMATWRDVAVAPNDSNIIYGLNTMGEIFKSQDAGSSWELQCRIKEYRSHMHLKVSPGPDATAYVSHRYSQHPTIYNKLYRVDPWLGRYCRDVIGNFRGDHATSFVHAPFSIAPNGDLYHVEDQYDSLVIRYSSDFGNSWHLKSQMQDSGQDGQLYFHPTNESLVLLSSRSDNSGSGTKGLYRSVDGGETWSFVRTTGFDDIQYIFFDPLNSGRVYANNTYVSSDNGASWTTDSNHVNTGYRWWLDNAGKGYRLIQSGGDTLLQVDSDLSTINFTTVYTFSGIQSSTGGQDIVSATGSTVVVKINDQLFLSNDSGATFNEVFWPGNKLRVTGLSSRDGKKIYAATSAFNVVDSSDKGDSWSFRLSHFSEECDNEAKIYTHHLNDDYVWLYARDCDYKGATTTDAFSTFHKYNHNVDLSTYKYNGVSAVLLNQYFQAEGYNQHSLRFTSNGFTSYNEYLDTNLTTLTGVDNQILSFSKVSNPNTYLFLNTNTLKELRLDQEYESADLTSRLPLNSTASLTMIADPYGLELGHVVMSETGEMAVTYDDAKSFSTIGTGSAGLYTCANRFHYINLNNSELMATSCIHGYDEFAWSTDGGNNWSKINLDSSYGIDCNISGIVMNHSKIIIGCMNNVDALEFYYTPVILSGAADDSLILGSELTGADLVEIAHSTYYTNIEYSLIADGASCNVATAGFSTTIPTDSDLGASGNYQVCVKLTNSSGTSYKTSTTIKYAASAPVFTSIDVANDAIDGVQYIDHLERSSDIVANLVAADYSKVRYALVSDSTTCDANITYSSTLPKTNSHHFGDEGDYKVCVAISNEVHPPVFGSSATFNFSKDQVKATLSNLPKKVSSASNFNIAVAGTNVTHYRYKHGVSPVNCADETGYSSEIAVATPISDSLTSYGTNVIDLCVQGIDNVNHKDQLLSNAVVYTFERANAEIDYTSFNINNYSRDWFEVEVAKWTNTPHIYARDNEGHVFLSTDRGSSFDHICTLPVDIESGIYISPLESVGAYASAGGNIYRLQNVSGDPCPLITSSFTHVASTFQHTPIAFSSKGEIYVMDETSSVDPEQSILKKSSDLGNTWTTVYTFDDIGTYLTFYIDPFNDNNFFITYTGTGALNYNGQWIVSKNGGESFEGIIENGVNGGIDRIQDSQIDFKFDPVDKGYIIANNGFYSDDNLVTFMDMTDDTINNEFSRWDIDSTGQAYRIRQNGVNIDIEYSTNLTTPAFSNLATFSSITAGVKEKDISVSADGATIAAVLNGRMYISLDSGAFNEVYTPKPRIQLSSISAEDNTNIYAIDREWNIFKSTNSSTSWSYADTYSGGCSNKWLRIRASKANSDYVIAYVDNDTDGCVNQVVSTDGFLNSTSTGVLWNSTPPVIAMDPANESNIMGIGNSTLKNSSDFFSSNSQSSLNTVNVVGHGFDGVMSTVDNNLGYYINGGLMEVDDVANTKTNISSSLTMANAAAGLEGFADGTIYVISRTGELNQSTNSGAAFASYAANPSLTSCNSRILRTLASDQANYISTACYRGDTVAFTTDAGASWTEIDLSSYSFSNTCVINDMALVDLAGQKKMIISCRNESAIEISL